jgi:hypothetical protein
MLAQALSKNIKKVKPEKQGMQVERKAIILKTSVDAAKLLYAPIGKRLFEVVQDTNWELLRSSQNRLQTRTSACFPSFECGVN